MADDDLYQDLPESEPQTQWGPPAVAAGDELPDRLRVHSLARVLGTTSRRVLDALSELDGRTRSPHSSVDRTDAVRVRDVLATSPEDGADEPAAEESTAPEVAQVPEVAQAPEEPDEPESRLILETTTFEQTAYMPLFVAPQPVEAERRRATRDEDDEDDGDDEEEDASAETDGDQSERPANRRRRRGRRGRGRGRGEQGGPDGEDRDDAEAGDETAETGEASEGDDDSGDDESSTGEGATRRRRRRRRRKSGAGDDSDNGSADDPPNTVVHERPPRNDKDRDPDAIQGISGSTRLEAKRQRRRDGRDAGRRRPPILSEAEFLARREAVDRVMVVRDKIRTEPPHEGARYTQIAVMEDGVVVEHFVTSAASASLVGNIYLGIVQNVLPSMEAAFVDIGRGRNGVLYAGEVNWEAAGLGGAQRKIEQALKPGDYVVVQVSKDPVGHKGARLTTQVSLAGRYLVYVPGASSTGISRKLPDTERQRLKEILRDVVPDDAGVIIRTASEGVKEEDIRGDVERLQARWTKIAEEAERVKGNKAGAAVALYEEPDVLVKVIRDLFNEDFSGLIVSGDNAWETITDYVNSVAPELVSKLTKYDPPGGADGPDVFAVHRIDEQLAKALDRKVWLPSGGTLVIDRTEAMTVVDVNTGKFTGAGGNLEQTVTKNNLEAAEEIVRQLRLRDIGGIVVIDFIDMVLESNRDLVLRRLTEALARDRTRHQVSEVTSLGLVQLTRKRLGTGLVEAFSTTCTHCSGRGIVLHADPVDTTQAAGRKSESGGGGGRRGKRGKRGRPDEAPVAKVPQHTGEHPMFKAMAAANGKHDDEEAEEELADELERETFSEDDADTAAQVTEDDLAEADESDDDESDDEDDDESDEDEDDEIDVDLDEDDEDLDDEDSLDVDSDDEDDLDDDSDDDDSEADEYDVDQPVVTPAPPVPAGRHRRRAAARPAGPPST
ncbi:Rne/Rng family ribonuclease [Mycobacterium sp. CVI_P3]|uniref:Rne/Rng family ribonuclease n=1 Tax=Mycobacterium pinniadriaticum TaxID=2994102 RepID=A0ABT3SF15_9MYCO|nr:Rne/Rng family ribonuclease [Mycobacterium pinniadriaticum]MCX2931056.1 Rne/Rng family ribonuclease [Mycobacterium pinniadriaticum]MCX2937480.1 Rne/Rng family ribonuclease [Mycobacterium pinniadriaticum]